MLHCKLQICCLIVIFFVAVVYFVQTSRYKKKYTFSFFDALLLVGMISLFFDGFTAYTVNYPDTVSMGVNLFLHACFFISIDSVVFIFFLYALSMTGVVLSRTARLLISLPFVCNLIVMIAGMPYLDFIHGKVSDYSMGFSVYVCFVMIGVYVLMTAAVFVVRRRRVERHIKIKVAGYLTLLMSVTVFQSVFPQSLVSSIGVTGLILGAYFCQEDPALTELEHAHGEMVTGFASLIENRDESTGEHVRRTTAYVKLLIDGLCERGEYANTLTPEYVKNLMKAAPLHDVGKIAVPDAVLQKKGRLTEEEFEQIKKHTVCGGKIIRDCFGNTGDKEYCNIASDVALRHHEKWNGKGYPDGLAGENIPLCARIMAVADVFDAVSQKRCYRDALPMDECFQIISEGSGRDFEPLLVEIFTKKRAEAEKIHAAFNEK